MTKLDDGSIVCDEGRVCNKEAVADDEAAALTVGWMRDVVVRNNVEHVRHICLDTSELDPLPPNLDLAVASAEELEFPIVVPSDGVAGAVATVAAPRIVEEALGGGGYLQELLRR